MPKTFTVHEEYQDTRLDKWFKNKVIDIPHSLIEKIIRQNKVKVNRKKTKSSYRVQAGDTIDVYELSKFKPENKNKKIKYKPKTKEIDYYDNYVIENNENSSPYNFSSIMKSIFLSTNSLHNFSPS